VGTGAKSGSASALLRRVSAHASVLMDTIVPRLAGDRILEALVRYPSVVLSHGLRRRDTRANLGCKPGVCESDFEAVAADVPPRGGRSAPTSPVGRPPRPRSLGEATPGPGAALQNRAGEPMRLTRTVCPGGLSLLRPAAQSSATATAGVASTFTLSVNIGSAVLRSQESPRSGDATSPAWRQD
jgi:hypothetical protein